MALATTSPAARAATGSSSTATPASKTMQSMMRGMRLIQRCDRLPPSPRHSRGEGVSVLDYTLEELLQPTHRLIIFIQHRIALQDLLPHRIAIRLVLPQLQRLLDVLARILNDAIVHAHHPVLRVSDSPA